MGSLDVGVRRGGLGNTSRPDAWWAYPSAVFLGLTGFVVYSTWAALQGNYFYFHNYLSPFYSPLLFWSHGGIRSWFGAPPHWLVNVSPALLILWAPGGFRLSCYYYRGAYYKSHWADPPACAVGEPRLRYRGERSFPLILQNVHRYFMYLAVLFIFILGKDAWEAMWFRAPGGHGREFGIGVGTLVLTLNVILLAGYTFGCHSLRHLIGGGRDRLSSLPGRACAYRCVTKLNNRHMAWAWCSLFWVAFSDLYVRLCAMGIWHDWRILR